MLEKLKTAIEKRAEHRDALNELQSSLAVEHADDLKQWEIILREWETDPSDPSKANPFEREGESKSGTVMML